MSGLMQPYLRPAENNSEHELLTQAFSTSLGPIGKVMAAYLQMCAAQASNRSANYSALDRTVERSLSQLTDRLVKFIFRFQSSSAREVNLTASLFSPCFTETTDVRPSDTHDQVRPLSAELQNYRVKAAMRVMNLIIALASEIPAGLTSETAVSFTPSEAFKTLWQLLKENLTMLGINSSRIVLANNGVPDFLIQLSSEATPIEGPSNLSILETWLINCNALISNYLDPNKSRLNTQQIADVLFRSSRDGKDNRKKLLGFSIQTLWGLLHGASTDSPTPPKLKELTSTIARPGDILIGVDLDLANSTKKGDILSNLIALGLVLKHKEHVISAIELSGASQQSTSLLRVLEFAMAKSMSNFEILEYLYQIRSDDEPLNRNEAEQQAIDFLNSNGSNLTTSLLKELILATGLLGNLGGLVGQSYLEAVGRAVAKKLGNTVTVEIKATNNGDGAQLVVVVKNCQMSVEKVAEMVDLVVKGTRTMALNHIHANMKTIVANVLNIPPGTLDRLKFLNEKIWPRSPITQCHYDHMRVVMSATRIPESKDSKVNPLVVATTQDLGLITGHSSKGKIQHFPWTTVSLPNTGPQLVAQLRKESTRDTDGQIPPFQHPHLTDLDFLKMKKLELFSLIAEVWRKIEKIEPRASYSPSSKTFESSHKFSNSRTATHRVLSISDINKIRLLLERLKNIDGQYLNPELTPIFRLVTDTISRLIPGDESEPRLKQSLELLEETLTNLEALGEESYVAQLKETLSKVITIFKDPTKGKLEQTTHPKTLSNENQGRIEPGYYRITIMVPTGCQNGELVIDSTELDKLKRWAGNSLASLTINAAPADESNAILQQWINKRECTMNEVINLIRFISDYPTTFTQDTVAAFIDATNVLINSYVGNILPEKEFKFWNNSFSTRVPLGTKHPLNAFSEGYKRLSIPLSSWLSLETVEKIASYYLIALGLNPEEAAITVAEGGQSLLLYDRDKLILVVAMVLNNHRLVPSWLYTALQTKQKKKDKGSKAQHNPKLPTSSLQEAS